MNDLCPVCGEPLSVPDPHCRPCLKRVAVDKPLKPLALLIPGLDGTGKLYYRQIESLSLRYRVRPWEFGRQDSFDYSDLVEEIGEATKEENPGSITVVGESFGGTIAIEFALAYPERVRHLALINTFSRYRRRTRIRLACRLAWLLRVQMLCALKDLIVDLTLAAEGVLKSDRVRYCEVVKQVYHPAYCRRLQMVRDVDLQPRLGEISAETYLFASGRDKLVASVGEAKFMASRIRNSSLFEFPHAGHSLLLTPGFYLADYL